jgi:hypothetical protein
LTKRSDNYLIIGVFKYILKKIMGTRAKEAFNYGVRLDQFDEEKFIHTKNTKAN